MTKTRFTPWYTWQVYYKKHWWNFYRMVYESNDFKQVQIAVAKAKDGQFD